ncbi:MAG: catalase family protein [Nitrospira sp.]|nr:catalase family protein [Nitrospira sp.]
MANISRLHRQHHDHHLAGAIGKYIGIPALALLLHMPVFAFAENPANHADVQKMRPNIQRKMLDSSKIDMNAPSKIKDAPSKAELDRDIEEENKELQSRNFSLRINYPTTKFETVPPAEAVQIREIVTLTRKLLKMRYPTSMARRGVHPKDHGCVKAKFTVNNDIPNQYKVGVFATPGKTYDTWVRFSNATTRVTPDLTNKGQGESRGMALKLMGVEGKPLLKTPGAQTQDFLLINQPMFAFSDVAQYLELTRIQLEHQDDISTFFNPLTDEKKKVLGIVGIIRGTRLGNPLESRYFSASPFLFGTNQVAKFAVSPRDTAQTPLPSNPSSNYLRGALKASLDPAGGKPYVFDFQVQLRTDPSLPIEDAASPDWTEEKAPFQNVATVTIGTQDFDNPLTITECEHLVFTPWHGLAEFQPLGGINRLRLGVYTASSLTRARPNEPSGFPQ